MICHSVTVTREILLRYILSEHDCSNKIVINIKQLRHYFNQVDWLIFAKFCCVQISVGLLAFIVSRYILLAVEEVDSFIHLFRFHVIIRKNSSVAWREQKLKLVYYFTENQKIRMH